jgi:hypothetical protein
MDPIRSGTSCAPWPWCRWRVLAVYGLVESKLLVWRGDRIFADDFD